MSADMQSAIAVALRRARLAKGLTRSQVGEKCGVKTMTQNISRIEAGKHQLNLVTLFRLCETYGIKPSNLLAQAEAMVGLNEALNAPLLKEVVR